MLSIEWQRWASRLSWHQSGLVLAVCSGAGSGLVHQQMCGSRRTCSKRAVKSKCKAVMAMFVPCEFMVGGDLPSSKRRSVYAPLMQQQQAGRARVDSHSNGYMRSN